MLLHQSLFVGVSLLTAANCSWVSDKTLELSSALLPALSPYCQCLCYLLNYNFFFACLCAKSPLLTVLCVSPTLAEENQLQSQHGNAANVCVYIKVSVEQLSESVLVVREVERL